MELYNHNLAESFSAHPNSPNSNHYVTALHLWKRGLLDTVFLPVDIQSEGVSIDHTIQLPSLNKLKDTSGDTFAKIRNNEKADSYFGALKLWKSQPSRDNASNLINSIDSYAEIICDQIGREGQLNLFQAKVNEISAITGIVTDIALERILQTSLIKLDPVLSRAIPKSGAFVVSQTVKRGIESTVLPKESVDIRFSQNNEADFTLTAS